MSLYQQARRLRRLRTYLIVGVVLLAMVVGVVWPRLQRLVETCPEPPTMAEDVPDSIRLQLETLYEQGLLYCMEEGLADLVSLNDKVYWGTDGVSSVLYFPADSLEGVGVTRYGTGSNTGAGAFNVGAPGASPPTGFVEDTVGRAALRNGAPEGASYFYLFRGAPADTDSAATVTIKGPAVVQETVTERDFFRDLDILWAWLQRKPPEEIGSASRLLRTIIVPERWMEVRRRAIDPALANDEGEPSFAALRDLAPTEPMLYQTVSGPLGTTVWVAGVVSGTTPSMVLAAPDGQGLTPFASSPWISDNTDVVLRHFAFDPLPPGDGYEARYWTDGEEARTGAGGAEPDYTWPVTVP